MSHLRKASAAALCLLAFITGTSVSTSPSLAGAALSPQQEKATFRVPPGFRVELVANEPNVIDPVAMCFDEDGRLYVAEMHGYPNGGVGTGRITSGVIKVLEDRDGDGFYETSRVYADGLRFPMGLMPYRGGLIVTQAPEILFLEDTARTGKADRRRLLYSGFALGNIQQMINSPQWGLDNWVYCNAALTGGDVRSMEKPDAVVVSLRGRGVRFHPDVPASLEPTSGGGQYGLTADEYQRWFVNTNSQHLRHIVLPDHYLRRNPLLAVDAVTLDIPEHGAACKVFRISPFEPWRVERTTRRVHSELAKRLPSTELVPGGYVTSGCSPCYYAADAFPPSHRGSVFSCDPANNLVLRDGLGPHGATFTARRLDDGFDFLASTDNWFRPVSLSIGPDGALYVLDFYREVIETPLSLPDDIKSRLNLASRKRGRIWRVVAETNSRGKPPALGKASAGELVAHLADGNVWWRLTAQRLLVERQDKNAAPALMQLAREGKTGPARAHALWTLDGLQSLPDDLVLAALKDAEPGVREQGLRLADERIGRSAPIRDAVIELAEDADPRVRFQLAFTLGNTDAAEAITALGRVVRRDADDPWTCMAVLSSVGPCAPALLRSLASDADFTRAAGASRLRFLTRLAALVGAKADDAALAQVLGLLHPHSTAAPALWQVAILDGLTQGLRTGTRSLAELWSTPPPALRQAVNNARAIFVQAVAQSTDVTQTPDRRAAALGLLAGGPFDLLEQAASRLLNPQAPAEVQLAAARALSSHNHQRVATLLLAGWAGYSPTVRREVLESLFARSNRLPALLDAIETKKLRANELEPPRRDQLRRHADPKMRQRVEKLLAADMSVARKNVVDSYRSALAVPGDKARGKVVFKRVCSSCHRLEGEGHQVGPDLLAALGDKTREQLLQDVLDPSREVDPRYLNYEVQTNSGRLLSGLIAVETATSVTLRRGAGQEDTLLRTQIDEMRPTAKSLMPEGLETQLTRQDVADVIGYLLAVGAAK